MDSFSTLGLPVSRKVSFWNEISSEIFAQMEIKPHDASRFDGTLRRERIGPLTLMEVCSSAAHILHTRAHVSALPTPSYLLLAPLQHELQLTLERAPSVRVRAGEFCLIDHGRPYELAHGDAVRTLCIDVPRLRFNERTPGVEHLVGRPIRPDSAMSRMLVGLLRMLGNEVSPTGATGLSPAFGHSLLSFLAATYSSYMEVPVGRGSRARAKSYRAYIDSRLGDSELKPADVASHFGVSERYLRAVLRADGEPFSAYVLRRRVTQCADLLRDPHSAQSTITEIAFQCGFSSATHFGQAFKSHHGLTPRDYRRQSGLNDSATGGSINPPARY